MPSVLLTAFDPYDRWKQNASWLALMEITRNLPTEPRLVTRRYPVDFQAVQQRLERDLNADFDFAIHLGQTPGSSRVRLEAIGLNVGGSTLDNPDAYGSLIADGPVAYRTTLPLASWATQLREQGIPTQVSYHAGTYLCNAIFYLSMHMARRRGLRTQSAFIHLPLDPTQAVGESGETPTMPAAVAAQAIRTILADLARRT